MGEEKKTILKKLGVIKRIRVRKREKEIALIEKEITPPPLTKNQELEKLLASFDQTENYTESIEEKTTDLISFEHMITDLEFKLRYLNLKDVFDNEYGESFPNLNSSILIVDGAGRHFFAFKEDFNRISGDLLSFFKANDLKPGEVIFIDYDCSEISDKGSHVVHIKTKQ
jgi:hypothetical protein